MKISILALRELIKLGLISGDIETNYTLVHPSKWEVEAA
jgi:hypothetical protein